MLVAYDGSAAARSTLAHAGDLARPEDRVTVVNVMREPGVGARLEPSADQRNRQWRLLDEARRFMAARGIEAETAAPVGDEATEILVAAEDAGADLIVVAGQRARAPHVRASMIDRIVQGASCDVLVVYAADAGSTHS